MRIVSYQKKCGISKMLELLDHLALHSNPIISLTACIYHTNHLFKIDGYNEPLACNRQQKGGGVAIISKKGVVMELHKKTQNNKIQILTAQNSGVVAMYTTAVYMKPDDPVNDSLIALENRLSDI